jgi:hypothetical protein
LSNEESHHAWHLGNKLAELDSRTCDFEAAVRLLDFSEENEDKLMLIVRQMLNDDRKAMFTPEHRELLRQERGLGAWAFIALRDGTMTIYHFRSVLYALKGALSRCPTLAAGLPPDPIAAVIALFEQHFPQCIDARDAVAHSADTNFNLAKQHAHSMNSPSVSNFFVSGARGAGRVYSHTRRIRTKGEQEAHEISIEISDATLAKLNEIKLTAYATFQPIAVHYGPKPSQSHPPPQP